MVKDHLGKEFKNTKEMCKHHGVDESYFYRAKRRTGSLEAALTPKVYIDHLGNKFLTKKEMREYHGVSEAVFEYRRNAGYSLEGCLTPSKSVVDHLGNEFKSEKDMCNHHNVNYATYVKKKRKGMSIKECLYVKYVTDHKGNKYNNRADMLRYYGVSYTTYMDRRKNGESLAEILEGHYVKDHLGNRFSSNVARAKHYGLSDGAVSARLRNGWCLEDALTIQKKQKGYRSVQDHNGKIFYNKTEMLEYYGIHLSSFNYRLRMGYSLEDALTVPSGELIWKSVTDHTGKVYPDFTVMCKSYNIPHDVVSKRLKSGWSLQDSLTLPMTSFKSSKYTIKDHLGNTYPTKKAMCTHYGVPMHTLRYRLKQGKTLEEALTGTVKSKAN